jgi:3',5'-cyclic AMP phosphodiesterase CpdA
VLLAQLSDTHLTTGVLASGPAERAHRALARVQALRPRPDCLVITGDLADHGEAAEYEAALALLERLDLPVHAVPGNHDHAPRMLEALEGGGYVRAAADEPGRCWYRVDYPGLRLLCCDSSVPGRDDGELGPTQLAWLDRELGRDPDVPAVLALHHHPVPSGIAVLDTIMLSDADRLAAVLGGHRPLTRILTGHLHRPSATMFAGALVVSAPSTYRQVTSTSTPPGPWPSWTSRPGCCCTTSGARPRSPTWSRSSTPARLWAPSEGPPGSSWPVGEGTASR